MEGLDYWRLCDELNIVQAALLIAGCDPGKDAEYVEQWDSEQRPIGYEAAKAAIRNALLKGRLQGTVVPIFRSNQQGYPDAAIPDTADLFDSYVEVESLRKWLSGRGLRPDFFFPEPMAVTDYLDPENPRYAPKLAAAVRAWEAVTSPGGKSPKTALMKWLREHASEFNLTDEDGKPNESGIEEIAKVANWQPSGGAPKTP